MRLRGIHADAEKQRLEVEEKVSKVQQAHFSYCEAAAEQQGILNTGAALAARLVYLLWGLGYHGDACAELRSTLAFPP